MEFRLKLGLDSSCSSSFSLASSSSSLSYQCLSFLHVDHPLHAYYVYLRDSGCSVSQANPRLLPSKVLLLSQLVYTRPLTPSKTNLNTTAPSPPPSSSFSRSASQKTKKEEEEGAAPAHAEDDDKEDEEEERSVKEDRRMDRRDKNERWRDSSSSSASFLRNSEDTPDLKESEKREREDKHLGERSSGESVVSLHPGLLKKKEEKKEEEDVKTKKQKKEASLQMRKIEEEEENRSLVGEVEEEERDSGNLIIGKCMQQPGDRVDGEPEEEGARGGDEKKEKKFSSSSTLQVITTTKEEEERCSSSFNVRERESEKESRSEEGQLQGEEEAKSSSPRKEDEKVRKKMKTEDEEEQEEKEMATKTKKKIKILSIKKTKNEKKEDEDIGRDTGRKKVKEEEEGAGGLSLLMSYGTDDEEEEGEKEKEEEKNKKERSSEEKGEKDRSSSTFLKEKQGETSSCDEKSSLESRNEICERMKKEKEEEEERERKKREEEQEQPKKKRKLDFRRSRSKSPVSIHPDNTTSSSYTPEENEKENKTRKKDLSTAGHSPLSSSSSFSSSSLDSSSHRLNAHEESRGEEEEETGGHSMRRRDRQTPRLSFTIERRRPSASNSTASTSRNESAKERRSLSRGAEGGEGREFVVQPASGRTHREEEKQEREEHGEEEETDERKLAKIKKSLAEVPALCWVPPNEKLSLSPVTSLVIQQVGCWLMENADDLTVEFVLKMQDADDRRFSFLNKATMDYRYFKYVVQRVLREKRKDEKSSVPTPLNLEWHPITRAFVARLRFEYHLEQKKISEQPGKGMRDKEKQPLLTQNLINENASKAAAVSASLAAIAEEIAAAKEACAATLLSRRNQRIPTRPDAQKKASENLPSSQTTTPSVGIRPSAISPSLRSPPPPPPLPISIVPEYDTAAMPDDEDDEDEDSHQVEEASLTFSGAKKKTSVGRAMESPVGRLSSPTVQADTCPSKRGDEGNQTITEVSSSSNSDALTTKEGEKVSIKGTKKPTGMKVIAVRRSTQDTGKTLLPESQKTANATVQGQGELSKNEKRSVSSDNEASSGNVNTSESSVGGGVAGDSSNTLSTAGMEPAMIVATALANPSFIPAAIAHFTVEMYKASAAGDASAYAVLYAAYCQLCTYASAGAVLGGGNMSVAPGSQKQANISTDKSLPPGLGTAASQS
ncbi:splicing arginine serine-rich protein, partial [Cystoisospora suis]